jgi:hypothetical protein
MSTLQKKRLSKWAILSAATGYSAVYCKKVVRGERSQTSKGGKTIMEKYKEFKKFIND